MKSLKIGYAIRAYEIVSLAVGLYWLAMLDTEDVTLIWFLIIVFISTTNILLSALHPSKINLFCAHHFSNFGEMRSAEKKISKVRWFIPSAIILIICLYLVGLNSTLDQVEWSLIDISKVFYVCSFIIYQLSFLRGKEDYLKK